MVHEPFIQTEENLLSISAWEEQEPSLLAGFTSRLGGVGKTPYHSLNVGLHVGDDDQVVIKNRQYVAALLKMPLEQWLIGEQIHGSKIKKITSCETGRGGFSLKSAIEGVDGLYTNVRNILLVSLYADCVPLYFWAPKHQMIGLAHAGWKGTVGNIGPKMIEKWTTCEGINTSDIYVAIGPAIGKAEYEVDTNVIQAVDGVLLPNEERPYSISRPGHYWLDLKKLNEQLILRAGIPKDNIKMSQYCTASSTDLFFSHRKERGKTGRMMSFLGYKDDKV